jgi:hypothetical protein
VPHTTPSDGFIQVVEGAQGIVHAPPIAYPPTGAPEPRRRARLHVRHYLEADEAGVVRIARSRLVALIGPEGAN